MLFVRDVIKSKETLECVLHVTTVCGMKTRLAKMTDERVFCNYSKAENKSGRLSRRKLMFVDEVTHLLYDGWSGCTVGTWLNERRTT